MSLATWTSAGWSEYVVAIALVASGLLSLLGAVGVVRLSDFFQRMHAPALAYTLGTWLAALAASVHFSSIDGAPNLQSWLLPWMLVVTVPVATILLGRAALFRVRTSRPETVPPPLNERR